MSGNPIGPAPTGQEEHMSIKAHATGHGPAAPGWPLVLVLATALLGGCFSALELAPQEPVSCSRQRLDAAAGLYEEAKDYLDMHFRERDNVSLLYAYYYTVDAEELTRSIRNCDDFGRRFRERGGQLIRANRVLRRVAVVNMRDPDPMVMIHLLGTKYDEVFKTDIR
jgi:hypothetical protein